MPKPADTAHAVQMNVAVYPREREFVRSVATAEYGSVSDFIRTLIRNEMQRREGGAARIAPLEVEPATRAAA